MGLLGAMAGVSLVSDVPSDWTALSQPIAMSGPWLEYWSSLFLLAFALACLGHFGCVAPAGRAWRVSNQGPPLVLRTSRAASLDGNGQPPTQIPSDVHSTRTSLFHLGLSASLWVPSVAAVCFLRCLLVRLDAGQHQFVVPSLPYLFVLGLDG